MVTQTTQAIEDRLIAWLQAVKPKATVADIRSSDLIETRILDSMQFLDFVFFLNELCETDVSQRVTVDDMRTLQRIVSFVEGQMSEKAPAS
jgi:acyl carrier protein